MSSFSLPLLQTSSVFPDSVTDFLTGLFAPSEFTSHLLESSIRQPVGWVELGLALALAAAAWWFSEWLLGRCTDKDFDKNKLLPHIGRRILWPALVWLAAAVVLALWNFAGYRSVWLRLLLLAANWMVAIRIVMAVVHAALPDKPWSDRLERSLSAVLWAAFVLWVSGIDDIIIRWMKSLVFSVGSAKLSLWTVSTGIIWIGVIMVFAMWLAQFAQKRIMAGNRLDLSLRIMLSNIVRIALIILSILIALPLVGIDLTVLSVFGGAIGVGIGFGLQKIASNYISGFLILGDRSIRPGDRLTVNGFTGYVTKITSRFVVLRSSAGTEALIPNETFITNMVVNESYTAKALHQTIDIQVSYDSDILRAMAIMTEAAGRQSRIDSSEANRPKAYLLDFAADGINLRLGFWLKDPENGFLGLFSALRLEIWQRFNEENISFPYPQREVRILNEAAPPPDTAALSEAVRKARADTRSGEPAEES
ncbi:mechanosensitive ion channel family protein [Kingella potus]|nr:mechanosensitive ion channel domain-containing protein [Kingella potus]